MAGALLNWLVIAGSIGGALAAILAGAKAVTNTYKSILEYRVTGSWEFTDAKRQRSTMIRELRNISRNTGGNRHG